MNIPSTKPDTNKAHTSVENEGGFVEQGDGSKRAPNATLNGMASTSQVSADKSTLTFNTFDVLNSMEEENQVVSNPKDVRMTNDVDLGTNRGTSNSADKGTIHNSSSNTPIVEKIDKIERQLREGKLMFVDDNGNPLVPTGVVDSDSEVEVVFDETANLWLSKSGKDGSDKVGSHLALGVEILPVQEASPVSETEKMESLIRSLVVGNKSSQDSTASSRSLYCQKNLVLPEELSTVSIKVNNAEVLVLLHKVYLKIKTIDQGLGSTSGIRAYALRNFDLEVMEFEYAQSNTTAKLLILKLENGNSWVSVPITSQENGTSSTKMSVPVTAEQKTNKKNDVKARSLLLMALPNEHQLTFSQYTNAKTMFATIEIRFRGNEATKKTQKALLKQQYENFNASSTESLDSIFNRLQKLVSRLAILGVVITQEDLNSKFLKSFPPEWNTHVVVWMNKADIKMMSIDDLYNNFKIVEQDVKKSVGAKTGDQNMVFMSAPSTSSTNNVNTANSDVSTISTNINTASPKDSTATLSDATVYAFLANQPNGSQLIHEDLEQIHDDDLEEMDLKWQLALLSMRARKFYQRTRKKITINGSDTVGYDKSKVECFNCHKMGHFARECRNPRNQESKPMNHDNWNRNHDSTRRTVNVEDTSSKVMLAIDGVGFDWSDMAEEQIQTNMALIAFS
ncbi:putative ribonuclease H-like domain-containing protein, partial [Tanacetum coccineum]